MASTITKKATSAAVMAAAATATKMMYTTGYTSPLGEVFLASDGEAITGLWFEGQKYFPSHLEENSQPLPVFDAAKRWLDLYFSGREPDFRIPVHFSGTPFQNRVWAILLSIPYGETLSYGQIAAQLGIRSAQAVGGAVGRNPISILIPCHRVVGSQGQLTGYAGGLDRKTALLTLEKTGGI